MDHQGFVLLARDLLDALTSRHVERLRSGPGFVFGNAPLFTSSMSAVAGSYSRSVVSPRDENVTILAFICSPLWDPAE